jgi:hypothetical protein
MPIAESPPNPTIQTLHFHLNFPLSYLGEMSNGQRGFPPFIFLFLQVVDIAIDLNDQRGLVTVKVDNKSLNHLLA